MQITSSGISLQGVSVKWEDVLRTLMHKFDGAVHENELCDEYVANIDGSLLGMDARH